MTRLPAALHLEDARGLHVFDSSSVQQLRVRRTWGRLVLERGPSLHSPRRRWGLPSEQVAAVERALAQLAQRAPFEQHIAAVTGWHSDVLAVLATAAQSRRWVDSETHARLRAARPVAAYAALHAELVQLVPLLGPDELSASAFDEAALESLVADTNEMVIRTELREQAQFLGSVEASPLTAEQARAVLTFDNRVHVIAAAGSGKTSVMVGRAAYAVHRGFVAPERILLLAFNRAAAEELQNRVVARFAAAGLPHEGVRATTFHAFGLSVIAEATGRKPAVAPWVADGREAAVLGDIVSELKAHRPGFALNWEMFRLLYSRIEDDWSAEVVPDAWDSGNRRQGLLTYGGDVVRSQGERLVADWLYLNGVTYEYERPYCRDTATAQHRQYHPDFYYPDIDAWHEHWALDEHGQPPPAWTGYLESLAWKRDLHSQHQTTLLETTWAGVMSRKDFPRLAQQLRERGIVLRWDPQRPTRGAKPVKDADVLRLVRTFMSHVKSNALTERVVRERLSGGRVLNRDRAELFADIYWPIHDAWQERLAAGGYVDFEDMLVQAAQHLEAGRYASPYELVLVDEFQDASQARARLTRALVDTPGRYLLAVGDDWQSINRFAGSDLSVLTDFHTYFGKGPSLFLSTTFRCHESVTQTASAFVSKNPDQLRKAVSSIFTEPAVRNRFEGVHLRAVDASRDVANGVAAILAQLSDLVAAGRIATPHGRALSVYVLGRYRHDRQALPSGRWKGVEAEFHTIHSSKGLEADYVIVTNMSSGTYGFPSAIADDPVLNLVTATPDSFPHAEERRLLYVAMTRARRGVLLLVPAESPSVFVTELIRDRLVQMDGETAARLSLCPVCRSGVMRRRDSRFGAFWACSAFPRCPHTSQVGPAARATGSAPRGFGSSFVAPKPATHSALPLTGPARRR